MPTKELCVVVTTLVVIGLVFIYSSSSVYALERHGFAHFFLLKQIGGVILGLVGLLCIRRIPAYLIEQYSGFLFMGSVIVTAITLIPRWGLMVHGSRRWLLLGGMSIQPSELMKYSAIIYYAHLLTKKQYQIRSWRGTLPYVIVLLIPICILLAQPDFGQAVTLGTTACMLWFIMQPPLAMLIMGIAGGLIGALILILKAPYRLRRLMIFLNPWNDPHGAGFQIIQSLIAIGSGGWFGRGITGSKQKFFYLPMQHTDFIGAIIAEETGFFGLSFLLIMYLLFLYYGMRCALLCSKITYMLTIVGIVSLIALQSGFNMAVICGIVPTKGISLPFVSYGNSSLVATLWALGVILSYSKGREI